MSVGEGEVGEREEGKGERKARETCDKEERVVTTLEYTTLDYGML
jgi:hypothetical protein